MHFTIHPGIALIIGLYAASASAIPEPALPAQVTIENITLNRCSIAPVKALMVFKVGYASLYATDCSALTEEFYETVKQLSFEYYREIPGDAFGKAAANFLKKNLAPETWDLLEEKISEFNSHYKDIKPGDRYDMIYTPGEGLQLLLNNELLTTEADPVFAKAYFEIWFGADPYDKTLKKRLLNP
jgi:hypothetical protein